MQHKLLGVDLKDLFHLCWDLMQSPQAITEFPAGWHTMLRDWHVNPLTWDLYVQQDRAPPEPPRRHCLRGAAFPAAPVVVPLRERRIGPPRAG